MTQVPHFTIEFGLNAGDGSMQLRPHSITARVTNDTGPSIFQGCENPKSDRKSTDETKQK